MTSGGVVLSPISTPVSSVCSPELLTKEDLFLLYARYFFPWETDPSGFAHTYGVYDASANETPSMCFGVDDRRDLMRALMLTYRRMAGSMRYFALPTYVNAERKFMEGSPAVRFKYGYLTSVAERTCAEVELGVTLSLADDGLLEAEVAMPSSTLAENLVAYETGIRNIRVPIAERIVSSDGLTVTLRFYRPTLVKASVWAACRLDRSPCGCSVETSDAASFMETVDIYSVSPIAYTGMDLTRVCACSPSQATACGSIENPSLGWVRATQLASSCSCGAVPAAYGTFYYTSGRWTTDTIPDDVLEGLFGTAFTLMPEAGICQESTRPPYILTYRKLMPSDSSPAGMRPLGHVLMRAAVADYALGRGI